MTADADRDRMAVVLQLRVHRDLLLHLGFILFVLLGGVLAVRWRWAPLLHLPAAAWGVYIELSGGLCPLTPLENRLRIAAGDAGYAGGLVPLRKVWAARP